MGCVLWNEFAIFIRENSERDNWISDSCSGTEEQTAIAKHSALICVNVLPVNGHPVLPCKERDLSHSGLGLRKSCFETFLLLSDANRGRIESCCLVNVVERVQFQSWDKAES